jgi:hypothetical protein
VSLLSAHGFQEHCELLLRAALGRFFQADGLTGVVTGPGKLGCLSDPCAVVESREIIPKAAASDQGSKPESRRTSSTITVDMISNA